MQGIQTPPPRAKRGVLRALLLIGMGLMIPCYLFTVGNVALSPWPLYERNRLALVILTPLCLALLLLLSVRRPYGAWIYENLQTDLYRDLCGFTLNAFGEQQRRHDEAVKLIRASHSFDFGLPCQRNDQIRVWESRLVAFADYYAGDAVDDLEETAPATSCVAEP